VRSGKGLKIATKQAAISEPTSMVPGCFHGDRQPSRARRWPVELEGGLDALQSRLDIVSTSCAEVSRNQQREPFSTATPGDSIPPPASWNDAIHRIESRI